MFKKIGNLLIFSYFILKIQLQKSGFDFDKNLCLLQIDTKVDVLFLA